MTALSPRNESSADATHDVRVMVVDDLSSFRRVARAVIDATPGFESVPGAASGREALASADLLHPDLVLLDIRMPEMGGVQAARCLHASHPEAILVLISLDELPNAPAALASCGAVAFVRKQDFGTGVLRRLWSIHGSARAIDD